MAYQTTYGPSPMYHPGSGQPSNHSASPFPHQLPPQQHQYQHQHQQLYPNAYPQQPSGPVSAYGHSAPGPEGQSNLGPRQQYPPFQNNGNAAGPLMQPSNNNNPSTMVPDDPFKKPYLPPQKAETPRHTPQAQQQFQQNAQSPPNSYRYSQQQSVSTATTTPTTAAFPAPRPSNQFINPTTSFPATSSMTVSAAPATSFAQTPPISETPHQATNAASQANKLSQLNQDRVDALLNVNNLLLHELQILQKTGLKAQNPAGNPQSPQAATQNHASSPQPKPEGGAASPKSTEPSAAAATNSTVNSSNTTPTATTPTTSGPQQYSPNYRKFVEYMNRLKTNIMYLLTLNDPTKQKQRLPYPTHLESLPNWLAEGIKEEDRPQFEALNEGYARLRELWPEWKPGQLPVQPQGQGQQQMAVQQAQSQMQMQMQPQSRT